jgi:hypothetical protein
LILSGTGVAFVFSKDIREHAINWIMDLYDFISSISKYVMEVLTNLSKGSVDIAVIFKDELGPYFVSVGFALMFSIAEMNENLMRYSYFWCHQIFTYMAPKSHFDRSMLMRF